MLYMGAGTWACLRRGRGSPAVVWAAEADTAAGDGQGAAEEDIPAGNIPAASARNEPSPADDIAFFNQMLDRLSTEYSVDAARIYATGLSDAAIAPVGAEMPFGFSVQGLRDEPLSDLTDHRPAARERV